MSVNQEKNELWAGCTFPVVFLLTIFLLVAKYSFAPALPWWLVWGPAILYLSLVFLFIGIFIVAMAITGIYFNRKSKK